MSDDLTHDRLSVSCVCCLTRNEETFVPFPDGAGSQFKDKYLFRAIDQLATVLDVTIEWNYLASHHGK